MLRSSNFDKCLDNATSHLRLEPELPIILQICDLIRQNDVTPKNAVVSIKKKMLSSNPHTAFYSLIVLESIVKNCGSPVHDEIATTTNCEFYSNLINTTKHENVKNKLLELIQTWSFAFRSHHKYRSIKDTMNILKADGHSFPELKEADAPAMFTADTAPDWADGEVCHRCRTGFSLTNRKHHCRNCGQVFCGKCSMKQCPLPKYGIEKDVRVCDGCFIALQKPASAKARSAESDLPVEYLTSSLAQQNQVPARRTEQELQEEEELQLALALSQSEAENKTKAAAAYSTRSFQKSPSPEETAAKRSPSPIDEVACDPELSKYLNRSFWEQRKTTESPTAPSPMLQQNNLLPMKVTPEDSEIDEFAGSMKGQLEIFVNRMKSNSSRGRTISTDSSVQTLFMTLTSLHSRLLNYIKDVDDKRLWYEMLQDKLNQIKDSRAALDVLRQEHQDKLRHQAEEMERLRQFQMAQKLDIMRKKKQEYLQYQRQIALQRIQEQEREMQMRQEHQKAQYRIATPGFPYMNHPQGSPLHQVPGPGYVGYSPMPQGASLPPFQGGPQSLPSMYTQPNGVNSSMHPGMHPQQGMGPQQGQGSQQGVGIPIQQNMPSHQGMHPQQGMHSQTQAGMHPQHGMPPQQGMAPPSHPPHGHPQPGMPPQHCMPQQGVQQQGLPPQPGMSTQQGMPSQPGMPPQQGMSPQQGMPPQQTIPGHHVAPTQQQFNAPNPAQMQSPPSVPIQTNQAPAVQRTVEPDVSIQKAMAAAPEPPAQTPVTVAKSDFAIAELISFD